MGLTWVTPKEITSSVKEPGWTWYATGPCTGIQIQEGKYKGRLIIPCDHIEAGTKKYYSHVIYSDDHGESWLLGGRTPVDQVNECQAVELADGSIMLNMRNYDRSKHTRAVSISHDGGITWGPLNRDPALIEPICQGSIIRYTHGGSVTTRVKPGRHQNYSMRALQLILILRFYLRVKLPVFMNAGKLTLTRKSLWPSWIYPR